MKLVSFAHPDGHDSWEVLHADTVLDVPAGDVRTGRPCPPTVAAFLSDLDATDRDTLLDGYRGMADPLPLDWVRLLAPIPQPRRNVFCLGPNYRDHVAESAFSADVPAVPIYFTKATTSVVGPDYTYPLDPDLTNELDWEIELGVVIGRGGRRIPADDALGHVFGYTVVNDLSARDLQHGRPEGQWFLGKSLDGLCPMGPAIVTADEVSDPQRLALTLTVNGVRKQQASTEDMVHTVAEIIADLSRYVTLLPGDIISTGTPGGVGGARTPPEFLAAGDTIHATIDGIGVLTTSIGAAP